MVGAYQYVRRNITMLKWVLPSQQLVTALSPQTLNTVKPAPWPSSESLCNGATGVHAKCRHLFERVSVHVSSLSFLFFWVT